MDLQETDIWTQGDEAGTSRNSDALMNSTPFPSALLPAAARGDIQGFLTSGFGHLPHSAWLFLQFDAEQPGRTKRWLRTFLPEVTSAAPWSKLADGTKAKPQITRNIALTADGLVALGLPKSCLESFPIEYLQGLASDERSQILGDGGGSTPERWDVGGPRTPVVHAVVLISSATPGAVEAECERRTKELDGSAAVRLVHGESGSRRADGREPFGFRDGLAQPEIKGITPGGVSPGEFVLGYPNEYGFHSVGPVLPATDDPRGLLPDSANPYRAGWRDFGLNGSFVVYRKLEQDVAGFWRFMEMESVRWRGTADPGFMVWLAAKMVGRWPGGAPLTLAPDHDNPSLRDCDDFLYAESDAHGRGCPFGAHIRRTNPRDSLQPAGPVESLHMTARHRILRRGKPYGAPLFELEVLDRLDNLESLKAIVGLRDDGQSRGLHFLCVNASIKSQFEFIQQSWSNNPHFNGLTDNRDPLTGNHGGPGDGSAMLIPRDGLDLRTATLQRFMTTRGGAYLFMPGLRALSYLAAEPV
jgi:Dyp-type peroxidase family